MVDNNTIVNVTNRSRGSVGYTIPDMGNLQRHFNYGETKQITAEEIRKLSYSIGGSVLLRDYLKIDNQELIDEILHGVEPEYFYTEEQIKELLLNGEMDAFMDCLDFAPDGVIDLMRDLAVKLEIPDIRKRDAISKKTGVDVNKAITINQLSKNEDDDKPEEVKQRRVQLDKNTLVSSSGRRTNPNTSIGKYKVISK